MSLFPMLPRASRTLACACLTTVVASAGFGSAAADTLRPIEAISYVLGSKHAAGYFETVDGGCHLTLMIAESVDPEQTNPLSAARVRFRMSVGQSASIDSEEGPSIVLTCGAGGRTLDARLEQRAHPPGNPRSALSSR